MAGAEVDFLIKPSSFMDKVKTLSCRWEGPWLESTSARERLSFYYPLLVGAWSLPAYKVGAPWQLLFESSRISPLSHEGSVGVVKLQVVAVQKSFKFKLIN